jgi:hypothetical protein
MCPKSPRVAKVRDGSFLRLPPQIGAGVIFQDGKMFLHRVLVAHVDGATRKNSQKHDATTLEMVRKGDNVIRV